MTLRNFNKKSDITGIIDLSRLPPPSFVDPESIEEIYGRVRSYFKEALEKRGIKNFPLEPDDPMSVALESLAYESYKLREKVNSEALQCLVPYAKGDRLDNLLILLGETRQSGESDDSFLKRSLLSLDQSSTTGSDAAYRFFVRKFFGEKNLPLRDVMPFSPTPGTSRVVVLISPEDQKEIDDYRTLAEDGSELKGEAGLGKDLLSYLNLDDKKPICDTIEVSFASIKSATIERARVYLPKGVDPNLIKDQILESLSDYKDRRFVLHEPITLSGIHAAITVTPDIFKVVVDGFNEDEYKEADETAYLLSIAPNQIEMREGS